MSLSNKLKQRFCKDCNINIQLFDEPFFTERVRLLGKSADLSLFQGLIENHFDSNEEAYFEYYNSMKDNIIEYIKSSKAFQALNCDDMNKYACKYQFRQSDVYKVPNIGKKFISIDMRKANFSSLVHYAKTNKLEFFTEYNWIKFMEMFTPYVYLLSSKYIRQVVFGNCNPKRQVAYEKYLMSLVLDKMFGSDIIKESDIYSMCSDEIIIYADKFASKDLIQLRYLIENTMSSELVPLKFEYFTLGKITNTDAFVKEIDCNGETKLEVKCASPIDTPAIYRMLNKEKPNENDLYFSSDNRLAKFVSNKDISIQYRETV